MDANLTDCIGESFYKGTHFESALVANSLTISKGEIYVVVGVALSTDDLDKRDLHLNLDPFCWGEEKLFAC